MRRREDGPDWDLVHGANLVLGHVALRRGEVETAESHLLAAGDVGRSPVLASFGPNMSLARALLLRGRQQVVLEYFDKCSSFWGRLAEWRADVEAGEMPNFRANLRYGLPRGVGVLE